MRLDWKRVPWAHAATGALSAAVVAGLLLLPGHLVGSGKDESAPIVLPATTAPAPVAAIPVVRPKRHVHRVAKPQTVLASAPVVTRAVTPAVVHVAARPVVHRAVPTPKKAAPRVSTRPRRLTAHETPRDIVAPPAPAPAPAPTAAPAPTPSAPAAAEVPASVTMAAPMQPAPVVDTNVELPDQGNGHGHGNGQGNGNNGNGNGNGNGRGNGHGHDK